MKRAQSSDTIIIVITLFTFTITAIIGLLIMQMFDDAISEQAGGNADAEAIIESTYGVFSIVDVMGLRLTISLFVGLVISGFYIRTHPVFFVVNLIGLVVMVFVSPILSNVLTGVMGDEAFSEVSSNFVLLSWLRDNYPLLVVVGGAIFFIALYAKGLVGGGASGYY